jgi:hypothetical protein
MKEMIQYERREAYASTRVGASAGARASWDD